MKKWKMFTMHKMWGAAFFMVLSIYAYAADSTCSVYRRLFSYFEAVQPEFALAQSAPAFNTSANVIQPLVVPDVSLDAKIGQLFMVSIDGKTVMPEFAKRFLSRTPPGAVLLFGRNIDADTETLISYIASVKRGVQDCGAPFEPLVCIDHEGGDVARLRHHTSPLPAAFEVASKLTPEQAFTLYYLTGCQLAAAGITINLAPVAEFLTEDNYSFLGTRSYSQSPKIAAEYAAVAVTAFQQSGIGAVVKHFPGNASGDPHVSLPVLGAASETFFDTYLAPFSAVCRYNPAGVLLSHVLCPAVDAEFPVCFSKIMIHDVLSARIQYNGLVISDDLCMGAVKSAGYTPEQAAVSALKAGCCLLMISGNDSLSSIHAAIKQSVLSGEIPYAVIDAAYQKIIHVKQCYGLILDDNGNNLNIKQSVFCFYAARNFADLFLHRQSALSQMPACN